jgi:mevalonate kinase
MTFPGKVLLFGEYTVILGGDAIALPSSRFQGVWKIREGTDTRLIDLLPELRGKATSWLDIKKFEEDVHVGWSFNSNIPEGYGLGSSGAFTAGLLARYGLGKLNSPEEVQEALAGIESIFHGQSSGLDPLISYFRKPVYRKAGHNIFLDTPVDTSSFYLLDTGRSRSTAPLVATFKSKLREKAFEDAVRSEWTPLVHQSIDALLERRSIDLECHLTGISEFCLKHMNEMIPPDIQETWEAGLHSGDYTMKICGAGGGGMFLVYTRSENIAADLGLIHL